MRIIHRSQTTIRVSRGLRTEIAIPGLETETGGIGGSAMTIVKVSVRNEALETDPVSRIGHNEEIEAKITMEANVDGIGGIQALERSRVLSIAALKIIISIPYINAQSMPLTEFCHLSHHEPTVDWLGARRHQNLADFSVAFRRRPALPLPLSIRECIVLGKCIK